MSSLLALSLLWMNSTPAALAWAPPAVFVPPSVTTNADGCRNRSPATTATSISLLRMSTTAVESERSLEDMTVPELKKRLRSAGRKVTGKKSELIERLRHNNDGEDVTNNTLDSTAGESEIGNTIDIDPSAVQLPEPLLKALIKYSASGATEAPEAATPKLLPIQRKSYDVIANGSDAVLFSPTGTGKTLAFVLPLAARLFEWKHDGSLNHQKAAQKKRFMRRRQQQNRNKNDSYSAADSGPVDVATPSILVVEPSRELARQVGKVWGKFHPTATKNSSRQVVTVYGGVPMQRHAAMMGSKTDVVVGTPGRIRELIREKYLSTAHLKSLVLDEADTLLNFKDNPEVEWLIDGMRNDYQLVLASATINGRVERFVGEVMELEVGEEGYVVQGGEGDGTAANSSVDDGGIGTDGLEIDGVESDDVSGIEVEGETPGREPTKEKRPEVRHWSMPASAATRVALTSDLVVTMGPRRGIVFVPSKAEAESAARQLAERLSSGNDVSIHILHGDMVQAARSRTVNAFRGDADRMTRILVATDVAARGLDLPAVDLVLQYGVPRMTGKDGTFDSELYIHRTGRAGRFGNTRTADAIVLFDGSQGERATLTKLQEEMKSRKGLEIAPRRLPSPSEVMNASYDRAHARCEEFGNDDGARGLVRYFADRLKEDLNPGGESNESEEQLMRRLAAAMAALSGLDGVAPPRSLLTADPRDRTIRAWNDSGAGATIPEIARAAKANGSGKLGRIALRDDGSAVFDLPAKRAERLLENVAGDGGPADDGWRFEMPESI